MTNRLEAAQRMGLTILESNDDMTEALCARMLGDEANRVLIVSYFWDDEEWRISAYGGQVILLQQGVIDLALHLTDYYDDADILQMTDVWTDGFCCHCLKPINVGHILCHTCFQDESNARSDQYAVIPRLRS
jgi:hypothetical protein